MGLTLVGLMQLALAYARWRSVGDPPGTVATGLIAAVVCGLLAHATWRGNPLALFLCLAWIGVNVCVLVLFVVGVSLGVWPSVGAAAQLGLSIVVLAALLRPRLRAYFAKRDAEILRARERAAR